MQGLHEPWWARGTKVIFTNRGGYNYDRKIAKERGLKEGDILTVTSSDTERYSSTVSFKEVDGVFNTAMFETIDENVVKPQTQTDKIKQLEEALSNCVHAMEMQLKRESGEFHITANTARCVFDETIKQAKEALGEM